MKCFGELSLKGWTGCSLDCPELLCKPTAVFVSYIWRTDTYVSLVVFKDKWGYTERLEEEKIRLLVL